MPELADHTLDGVPVSQITTSKIKDCLAEGIKINDSNGYSIPEAIYWVMMRLEIELIRRSML